MRKKGGPADGWVSAAGEGPDSGPIKKHSQSKNTFFNLGNLQRITIL
jgi:hypothetical protein